MGVNVFSNLWDFLTAVSQEMKQSCLKVKIYIIIKIFPSSTRGESCFSSAYNLKH